MILIYYCSIYIQYLLNYNCNYLFWQNTFNLMLLRCNIGNMWKLNCFSFFFQMFKRTRNIKDILEAVLDSGSECEGLSESDEDDQINERDFRS